MEISRLTVIDVPAEATVIRVTKYLTLHPRVRSMLLPHAPPIMPVGCPGRGHRANSQSRSSPETGKRHHTSVRNPRPTLHGRASNRAPMSARAVAVIRPAPTIIARLPFLFILFGP